MERTQVMQVTQREQELLRGDKSLITHSITNQKEEDMVNTFMNLEHMTHQRFIFE